MLSPVRASNQDINKEFELLKGRWQCVREVSDGNEMPVEDLRKTILVFGTDATWQIEFDGKVVAAGNYIINHTIQPKTINYTFSLGDLKGQIFVAIYELDKKSFRHCGAMKGPRPAEFVSRKGSGNFLTFFERVGEQ